MYYTYICTKVHPADGKIVAFLANRGSMAGLK